MGNHIVSTEDVARHHYEDSATFSILHAEPVPKCLSLGRLQSIARHQMDPELKLQHAQPWALGDPGSALCLSGS